MIWKDDSLNVGRDSKSYSFCNGNYNLFLGVLKTILIGIRNERSMFDLNSNRIPVFIPEIEAAARRTRADVADSPDILSARHIFWVGEEALQIEMS